MNKRPEHHELAERWKNLARFNRQPFDAARPPWSQRHSEAVQHPRDAFERALVSLLTGWLLYADAQQIAYGSSIGDDGVLGAPWAAIGMAVRELLNGHLGRLDGGTLDRILCDTLQANGGNPED